MRDNFGRCRRRWGTLFLFFFVWIAAKQSTAEQFTIQAKRKSTKHYRKSCISRVL